MPKTLDNHLVGVTADRPHPESYGADVPLRSEFALDDGAQEALDDAHENGRRAGYVAGQFDAEEDARDARAAARRKHEEEIEEVRGDLDDANEEIAMLRQQLEAKKSA